jgi:CysZ protein
MFKAALTAVSDIFSPPFRAVLWKSLALTLALLVALGYGAQWGIAAIPDMEWAWANTTVDLLAQFILVIVLIVMLMPVASLFAGLFLEEIAGAVEDKNYPADPPGKDQPFWQGLWLALKFTAVLVVLNLLALPLYFIPIVGVAVFWLLNGYLLSREYFELVALRHLGPKEAASLRRTHRLPLLTAGFLVAALASVPLLNLFVPLFATAFMVHVYKRITRLA